MTDQTRNTDKSKATPDQPPSADSGALRGLELLNPSRRRLTQAGLAAPLLVSLAARPVWGSTGRCSLSGDILSGNLSNPEKDYTCTVGQGCTPGFWRNNVEAWDCTGYSPGRCQSFDENGSCTTWSGDFPATTFLVVFDYSPLCAPSGASLMDVLHLCKGADLDWHAVAAVLNAACSSIDYGATVEDVKEAYRKAREGEVDSALLKDVFDNMNNRGCPIDRFGRCEDGFVLVEGQCIPYEPSGSDGSSGGTDDGGSGGGPPWAGGGGPPW